MIADPILSELADALEDTINLGGYARAIKVLARLRSLISAGWVLVPGEATEGMIFTGGSAHNDLDPCGPYPCDQCDNPNYAGCRVLAAGAYRAMIAARPKEPEPRDRAATEGKTCE